MAIIYDSIEVTQTGRNCLSVLVIEISSRVLYDIDGFSQDAAGNKSSTVKYSFYYSN